MEEGRWISVPLGERQDLLGGGLLLTTAGGSPGRGFSIVPYSFCAEIRLFAPKHGPLWHGAWRWMFDFAVPASRF